MQNKFVQLIIASILGAAITITASALFRKGEPFNYANPSTPAYLTNQKGTFSGIPSEGFTMAAENLL